MGIIREPEPGILFCAVLYNPQKISKDFIKDEILKKNFGEIIFETSEINFSERSSYYEKEMGKDLHKFWVGLDYVLEREKIVDIKLKTNKIEKELAIGENRVVNLDPGLLTFENVVLVTTKSWGHRIYMGRGIFAEVTLIYKRGKGYLPLEWTYPDYREEFVLEFFKKLREKLYAKLRGREEYE